MNRVQLFENLVLMALADGNINMNELELLSDRCQQWGITDAEFREAIERASSPGVEFQIPERVPARVDLLKEMVRMMGADGKITSGEKQLFAAAAATMKISDVGLNQIIDSAVE